LSIFQQSEARKFLQRLYNFEVSPLNLFQGVFQKDSSKTEEVLEVQ